MAIDTSHADAYEIDGRPASAAQFTQTACDPARSVVVEACAGSGKTWLLVARALRILLAGAQPSELLAITFTRKAAQEMHARLMQLLQELALASDGEVRAMLLERGVRSSEIEAALPVARDLYQHVLASSQPLSIDTFHGWFSRLIRVAPLGSGVPHGCMLTEATGELRIESYRRFMRQINEAGYEEAHRALSKLYERIGDTQTKALLEAFIDKRAEWWAACEAGEPIERLEELCGGDGNRDARLALWKDGELLARIGAIATVLGKGTPTNQARAERIESSVGAAYSVASFMQLLNEFCDESGKFKSNSYGNKNLVKSAEQHFGAGRAGDFEQEFIDVAHVLYRLHRRSFEGHVLELNRALFVVGAAYLESYQALKAERRLFDFSDLEWHAYRLLNDGEHAAYLQGRLDARYRHILLDEFQDTNPLQWSVMRAWLDAYGDDAGRPSVFIVGDPKQSIYRFRRADPRVFEAARELLRQQGAAMLRTGRTRRNAKAIVELLNGGMQQNRLYSAQTTCEEAAGSVLRLPLIQVEKMEKADPAGFCLRDPLTTPREEEDDARRIEEGRAVAQALRHAKHMLSSGGEAAEWKDVMLLVKKRTHLAAYESALREAGIPFISDRRGGLLDSLEALDLIALLNFLITPGDDLALAHVLKSPIGGAADDDLIALAQRGEESWWQRVQAAARGNASEPIRRAARLLRAWIDCAPHLPVHDLLDRLLHEGELIARYAQTVSPSARAQTLGNIDAFIELALNLDAGRYPSLPKFIDALRMLQKVDSSDAPSEASIDAATNAVRILTIHSAKGLEARIVVLLDANHSEPARDDFGVLCSWPQEPAVPIHFSVFGRKGECGTARDELFAEEDRLKAQEDWNLLYVAATRAKEVLIISGVADGRPGTAEGLAAHGWYGRLLHAPEFAPDVLSSTENGMPAARGNFTLSLFSPPELPSTETALPVTNSAAIDEGIALHALLERLTHSSDWPIIVPDEERIAKWLSCTQPLAAVVRSQASAILAQAALERFFHPQRYRSACNELEVITEEGWVRFDRLVVFDDEVWILDYKRKLLDSERAAYGLQLAMYCKAAQAVFPGKKIRTAVITGEGELREMA